MEQEQVPLVRRLWLVVCDAFWINVRVGWLGLGILALGIAFIGRPANPLAWVALAAMVAAGIWAGWSLLKARGRGEWERRGSSRRFG
jgi:hypothetical protein